MVSGLGLGFRVFLGFWVYKITRSDRELIQADGTSKLNRKRVSNRSQISFRVPENNSCNEELYYKKQAEQITEEQKEKEKRVLLFTVLPRRREPYVKINICEWERQFLPFIIPMLNWPRIHKQQSLPPKAPPYLQHLDEAHKKVP